jgi:hypothetical protein
MALLGTYDKVSPNMSSDDMISSNNNERYSNMFKRSENTIKSSKHNHRIQDDKLLQVLDKFIHDTSEGNTTA